MTNKFSDEIGCIQAIERAALSIAEFAVEIDPEEDYTEELRDVDKELNHLYSALEALKTHGF